jgi:hypothetical protein
MSRRKKGDFGWGESRAPAKSQWVTTARSLADYGLLPMPPPFYFTFFFFFFFWYYEEVWGWAWRLGMGLAFGDGPGILGEWVYNTPIFGTLPLYLGG